MAAVVFQTAAAGRRETLLREWQFARGDSAVVWENVRVPHDWAIYGPFDRNNDLQEVAVTQDGEKQASLKTGGSGDCPIWARGGTAQASMWLPEATPSCFSTAS